jgi:N-acetyl sugar amidotransferase
MHNAYQICANCIMDTSDPDIVFDTQGICNHCRTYNAELPKRVYHGSEAERRLAALVASIKKSGRNKPYDCVVGISGGVDSTYVAYIVKNLGLRPLAIHFDNGWNSELAVNNISKTLNTLGIDLHTYVIDWEEFRSLQIAFLRAATPDGEVPTDHAISALLFHEASKRGIGYIISGMNYATESSSVPAWAYGQMDWRYIRSVNRLFGTSKLTRYPHIGFIRLAWYSLVRRIRVVAILNYLEYNNADAVNLLQDKLGWKYYGGKHYESIYTRFYQGYILPQKYNVDKRIAHLSALINSGQLSRAEALAEMQQNEYTENGMAEADRIYVQKKLALNDADFNEILKLENRSFRDYPNSYKFIRMLKQVVNKLREYGLVSK